MNKKSFLIVWFLLMAAFMPCFGLEWWKGSINWEDVWFAKQEPWSTALSQAQCPWDYYTVDLYLDWDADGDWVKDLGKQWFLDDNARYYWNENTDYRIAAHTVKNSTYQGSSVRYYVPEDRMLKVYLNWSKKSLSDTSAWYRASSVFPINQWVRALSSQPFLISAPSNKSNNTIQIAYKIRYTVFRWYNSWKTSSYVAMPVSWRRDNSWITSSDLWRVKNNASSWDDWWPKWKNDYVNQSSSVITNSIKWNSEEKSHDYECMNLKLAWCWDGIVQNGWSYDNWASPKEECDWWSNCTADCKLIPDASCNSELDWKTKYDNNTTTSWVERSWKSYCSVWTSSWYKWEKSTWKITWTCTNWTSIDSCEAKQTFCWNGSVEEGKEECDGTSDCDASCKKKNAPVVNAQCNSAYTWEHYNNNHSVPLLNEDMNLCSAGTISDFSWDDKWNYSWKCNGTSDSKKCEAKELWCWDGEKNGDESCDWEDWAWEYWCNSSCEQKTKKPVPDISKNIEGEKTEWYLSWDTITFRVSFKNSSSENLSNVIVRDFLPLNVKYVSSEISWVEWAKKKTYYSWGIQEVVEYSNFGMKPNDEWYIIITGTVLWINKEHRWNVACSYYEESKNCVSIDPYKLWNKSYTVEKKVIWEKNIPLNENITYSIVITNQEGKYDNLIVEDTLPEWLDFLWEWYLEVDSSETTTEVQVWKISFNNGLVSINLKFPKTFKTDKGIHQKIVLNMVVKAVWSSTSYVNKVCVIDEENNKVCDEADPVYVIYGASCNSEYSGDVYNKKYPEYAINTWLKLCSSWEISDFSSNGRLYAWKCGLLASTASCKAKELWCWDGAKNWDEPCDYKDEGKEWWWDALCSETCELVHSKCWNGVIDEWEKCDPKDKKEEGWWDKGCSESCEPINSVCWDGKREGNEKCDYKDEDNKDWWWEMWCNKKCEPIEAECWDGVRNWSEQCDYADVNRVWWWWWSDWCSKDCKTQLPPIESLCGNGNYDAGESCDLWRLWWIIGKDGSLFKNWSTKNEDKVGAYCSAKCQIINKPKCFNLQDGSVSIMQWEMLPFYWNMEGLLWDDKSPFDKEEFLKDNFFHANWGGCGEDDYGRIDLDSMVCHYKVYGPNNPPKSWVMNNVVYDFTVNCVWENWWWNWDDKFQNYYDAIQDFIKQNQFWFLWWSKLNAVGKDSDVFHSLNNWTDYPSLLPLSSKLIISNFGTGWAKIQRWASSNDLPSVVIKDFWEYKLSLNDVSYKRCVADADSAGNLLYDWDWNVSYKLEEGDHSDRVCQVNFAVTNPYFVQKSVYWSIDEETANSLSYYKTLEWFPLFTWKVENLNKDKDYSYPVPLSSDSKFDVFIKKYARNAENITTNKHLVKKATYAGFGNLKKVRWKEIYIVEWNAPVELPAALDLFNVWTKPFTVISTDWADFVISGSILQNMMLITEWKIIFDGLSACNWTPWTDWHAWQVVKWIFYAGWWYKTQKDIFNVWGSWGPKNHVWCNYWNLHIKWVVLGDLTNVWKNRRSELYTWFSESWYWKKDTVLNWASLLLEYNPTLLWWELPPWGEEFNKLLKTERE